MQVSLNPCNLVRQSSKFICLGAKNVRISESALEDLSLSFQKRSRERANTSSFYDIPWDPDGIHFKDDAENYGPWTAQFLFVVDSINFCFWPCSGFEYDTLVRCLLEIFRKDQQKFSASSLSLLGEEELATWFEGFELSQLEQRTLCLNQLGALLEERYEGLALNLIHAAEGSAVKLVRLLCSNIPAFRDETMYEGCQIFFYKRTQILVGDLWGAYGKGRVGFPENPCAFHDISELTMFADYRVPQLLRARGVLEYSESLAARIDSKEIIPSGSEEEIEIRAATIGAVEKLKELLLAKDIEVLAIELDWLLWEEGEKQKDEILPHHQTLSLFY